MRTRLALFLLLLFAPPSLTFAASPDRWLQVHTEHFRVITNSSEKDARHVAAQFERMQAVFHRMLPTSKPSENLPITVIALKDKKSFQAIEPAAYLAKGQLQLSGLFLRVPDKNYILVRLDDSEQQEHPYATVYHEYTHLLNSKAEWLPLWLNEGSAEFYQNTDISDKDARFGQPSADDILYLRQQRLIPLTTLLTVDHNSPYYHEEQKGSVFYAESWALTHYLIVTDRQKNTNRLHDYVVALANGKDSVTAAQQAFGDLKKLEQDLFTYIGQGSFSFFKMSTGFPIDEASFHVEPLASTDADSIRADVLVYDDRETEAKALLDTVLRDDPKNALAHETMGFLNFHEHDNAAAAKWFGEAVELNSQSYLAYYYFAVLSMEGNRSKDDAIESSLRTAIKLNPSFAPSYDALAHFYGERERHLDEAHLLSVHAVQLEPSNVQFRLTGANILMEQNQPSSVQNAINVLQTALKIAKAPEDVAMVQAQLRSVQQYKEMRDKAMSAGNSAPAGTVTTVTTVGNASAGEDHHVVMAVNGKVVVQDESAAVHYPEGPATGPHHTISGTLKSVKCIYPSTLALDLDVGGKITTLYSSDYYKLDFYTLNFQPQGDLKPCTDLEGLKARIEYAEVTDKSVAAGQMVKVELSKPPGGSSGNKP